MEYRRLGRTGLMVSELCLGSMTFELDEEGSRIIARFFEAGGNFITSPRKRLRMLGTTRRAPSCGG